MLPKKRKPVHPGQVLELEFLRPLGLTSRQFAEMLGGSWNEVKVEAIIKGKENIPDQAMEKFAAALKSTPQFWRHLQNIYNQWTGTHERNEKGSLKPWKKAQ
ncbi:MAG: HigA family addiction module antidote protein [Candidatus Melainabacteria bacterium]|nr:HigA family addiction module antidote protein [Candidatus Melainabacteria bacterium]